MFVLVYYNLTSFMTNTTSFITRIAMLMTFLQQVGYIITTNIFYDKKCKVFNIFLALQIFYYKKITMVSSLFR